MTLRYVTLPYITHIYIYADMHTRRALSANYVLLWKNGHLFSDCPFWAGSYLGRIPTILVTCQRNNSAGPYSHRHAGSLIEQLHAEMALRPKATAQRLKPKARATQGHSGPHKLLALSGLLRPLQCLSKKETRPLCNLNAELVICLLRTHSTSLEPR